jgi:hypothetical protein
MHEAHTGFFSVAHLRDDEYWREILGQELHLEGPCQWVESDFIHCCVGVSIIFNAVAISMRDVSSYILWGEQAVLVFSVFELLIILTRRRAGIKFKSKKDAFFIALDCMVVSCSVLSKWVMPLAASGGFRTGLEDSSVVETLVGMIWLFRFVRLIRIVPALKELAHGVMDAIQGLFWVLCFMLLLIYAIAILCTRLIGHFDASSLDDPQQQAEVEEVQAMFRDVRTSMFYLFETMSSWTLVPLIPLFQIAPITRIFFVLFYIYAGWTLLAVMTGVVSFNMIALRAQITKEDDAREAEKKEKAREMLLEIFDFSDNDRSGELDKEEFASLVTNKEIIETIQANTNIKVGDLEDLWHWLDDDSSESISWEEFSRGFQWLNEPFKPKTLLRLQEKITKEIKNLKRRFHDLIQHTFDSIVVHVNPPMRKMHAVTEQVQLLGNACHSLRSSIAKMNEEAAKTQQIHASQLRHSMKESYTLADFEERMGSQIDDLLMRLDRFVPTSAKALEAFNNPAALQRAQSSLIGGRADIPSLPQAANVVHKDPLSHSAHPEQDQSGQLTRGDSMSTLTTDLSQLLE